MATYRSTGRLDDPSMEDGDRGFVGINQREQPNQLRAGEVVESKNGRIDGAWQPRKGVELKSGQLSSSALPLRLPFFLADTQLTITAASRASNVVTLTVGAGHNLTTSEVGYLVIGDPDVSTNPLTGTDDVEPGGYEMTVTSSTQMTFEHTGADETLVIDGTYGYLAATLNDDAVSRVYGVCRFSDPSASSDESVFLAVNTEAKRVDLDDYTISTVKFPTGSVVTGRVDMIQAFDRVYLFQEGVRSWEYIPQGRNVDAADYTSASGIVEVTLPGHGFTVGDTITTASIGFATTDPNGSHTVSTVVDADTFQYVIATGGGDETYTASTGTATSDGFSLVEGGVYTQKQAFDITGAAATASGGSLTLTVTSNTTFAVGDDVQIFDTDVPQLQSVIGRIYKVTAVTGTNISFQPPVGDFTGDASEFIEFGSRVSADAGFIHMPAPPWGIYFQRRLWCPYWYENGGTAAAPTYTDRSIRDDIVVSDILDSSTFDRVLNQFRTTGGSADYLVGMQPFYDDNIIILNRNSLHLLRGTQGSLNDTTMRELTREIGCISRKSVVMQGNQIFFLSDSGVYVLQFLDEYNLRGVEEPLSKAIDPYMRRVNESLASLSTAIYFDNRYYLALPLDSTEGAGDAQGNNTILVYNMLNKAWESIDTIGDGDFLIEDFVVGQGGDRNNLYIVNQVGGLHLANALNAAQDTYSLDVLGASTSTAIDYDLQSRGYDLGSFGRKKYRTAQVQMQSDMEEASDVSFLFNSEDPDTARFEVTDVATQLGSWTGSPGQLDAGESANFRFRLGNPRGFYGQLTIRRKIVGSQAIGRPKVTSIKISGTETNRNTLTQL